jgi:hypothetical protein
VPRQRTSLIEAGVLVGALHSTATAASMAAAQSTGNARRSNHKAAPRAAPTALQLAPAPGVAAPGALALPAAAQREPKRDLFGHRAGERRRGRLPAARRPADGRLPTVPLATSLQALLNEVIAVGDDARVVSEQPVLAPTVVWRPPTPVTW